MVESPAVVQVDPPSSEYSTVIGPSPPLPNLATANNTFTELCALASKDGVVKVAVDAVKLAYPPALVVKVTLFPVHPTGKLPPRRVFDVSVVCPCTGVAPAATIKKSSANHKKFQCLENDHPESSNDWKDSAARFPRIGTFSVNFRKCR